jgi:hypothetical protein
MSGARNQITNTRTELGGNSRSSNPRHPKTMARIPKVAAAYSMRYGQEPSGRKPGPQPDVWAPRGGTARGMLGRASLIATASRPSPRVFVVALRSTLSPAEWRTSRAEARRRRPTIASSSPSARPARRGAESASPVGRVAAPSAASFPSGRQSEAIAAGIARSGHEPLRSRRKPKLTAAVAAWASSRAFRPISVGWAVSPPGRRPSLGLIRVRPEDVLERGAASGTDRGEPGTRCGDFKRGPTQAAGGTY